HPGRPRRHRQVAPGRPHGRSRRDRPDHGLPRLAGRVVHDGRRGHGRRRVHRAMTATAITPEELVAPAAEIGPTLVERQAETEARTCYAPDTHEQFRDAGFYRMLVPRRYGGLEFDIPTFVRVIVHITHGCGSTGWQLCLPTAHALLVAAWYEERAQDELFANPDFLCPSVAAPVGQATPTGDGYLELTGTHR